MQNLVKRGNRSQETFILITHGRERERERERERVSTAVSYHTHAGNSVGSPYYYFDELLRGEGVTSVPIEGRFQSRGNSTTHHARCDVTV